MTGLPLDPLDAAPRFTASDSGGLTREQQAAWRRDGFLVLEHFFSADTALALNQRLDDLLSGFDPEREGVAFDGQGQNHAGERYFLDSGDKVRFFTEADGRSVNKIGHALHDRDPLFNAFSRQPRLAALCQSLGLDKPLLLQSMALLKEKRIGAAVDWHQDASFLITDPPSVIGFWFALDDATRGNGCMIAAPGTHHGPLRQIFRRGADGLPRLEKLDATPWPDRPLPLWLEAPRGSLILLHGLLPHASLANLSGLRRRAYALHILEQGAEYGAENWLQRPAEDPARGFGEAAHA